MDTKRFPGKAQWTRFENDLSYKLGRLAPYDAIIVADDNALSFAIEQQNRLFKHIPLIFMGVNNIEKALAQNDTPQITGVVEAVSMAETIELMIKLRPKSKRIVAIVDNTKSGQADLKKFYGMADRFTSHRFEEISLAQMDWPHFLSALGTIEPEDAVLLLSAYNDKNNKAYLFEESLRKIKTVLQLPIFHLWYHGIGEGLFGGKVISHFEQGKTAAGITLEILSGTPVSKIAVKHISPNKYVFDYAELKRNKIDFSRLPKERIIVNEPDSFYKKNKKIIWAIATTIAVLSLAFLISIASILNRLKIQKELNKAAFIIDSTSDAVITTDVNGTILFWNKGAQRIYGYNRKEVLGRSITLLYKEEDLHVLNGMISELLNGNDIPNIEVVCVNKDGRDVYILLSLMTIKNAGGKIVELVGITKDISESKAAEQAVARSEERLKLALDSVSDAVWDWRIDKDQVYFSTKWYSMLGYPPCELPQTFETWRNLLHPDDLPLSEKTVFNHLKSGRAFEIEFRMRTKQNQWKWILARGKTVEKDANGKALRMLGTHMDITERKRAEKEIIEQKQKAERYLNLAGVMFIGIDLKGRVNLANQHACNVLECEEKDLVHRNWFDNFIPEAVRDEVRHVFNQLVNGVIEPVEYYENNVLTKTGREKTVAWHNTYLTDEKGAIVSVLSAGEDITEKRKLEAQLHKAQKMESIGNLAGGIAHDFNNLLFPIIGMSELMMEDLPDNSPEHQNLKEILKAGLRGADLVKQILAFSRQSEIKKEPLRIQSVLKDAIHLSRSAIPADIEISHDIQQNCGMILGDATQIQQIAMNLITNAYHSMEQSGGNIGIFLGEETVSQKDIDGHPIRPGKYALLEISDTGCGIDPAIKEKIFEPYFTTKEKGKGTGLGLAVVYGIVKEHGGEIILDTTAGRGTTFRIYFPLIHQISGSTTSADHGILPKGDERLLLIDDEKAIVKLETLMLERAGYAVTAFTGSMTALDTFRKDPDAFDLVITDMTMPEMTGDQLAQKIISIRPDMPVITCTGFSERINEDQAREMGIKGFLMKPVVISDMMKMVRKILDEAAAHTGTRARPDMASS
ncbi:MAG: PAS domain S-box protein [Desulfobacter sp.]|nr:MAG: PAS domain S-box protein [Desulfobacter sp.]